MDDPGYTCDPQTVFDFISDLANWPRWAIVNVKTTRHGILDRDFIDPRANFLSAAEFHGRVLRLELPSS
jgi:hypothetical protein